MCIRASSSSVCKFSFTQKEAVNVSICGCIIREHVWSQSWMIKDRFVFEKKGKTSWTGTQNKH